MQYEHNGAGLSVRSKIWLEKAGKPVLGVGRLTLLKAVDIEGSISKAAKRCNISFRKAWSYLDSTEKNFGIKLLDRKKGGAGGGRSTLTPEARRLIERFDSLSHDTDRYASERFEDLFKRRKR
jgi:molybdate transport system regulatory protein